MPTLTGLGRAAAVGLQRRLSGSRQLLPTALFLAAFAVAPVAFILVWSFWTYGSGGFVPGFTLENYRTVGTEYLDVILFSVRFAALAVAVNVVVAYPVAYYIWRYLPEDYQLSFLLLLLIPAIVVRPIRIYLLSLFLSTNGPLNQVLFFLEPMRWLLFSERSMYLGLLGDLLPVGITLIWISLLRIEEDLLTASADLGAGDGYTFRRVVLPLSAPGIAAASIIMSVIALGTVTVSQILGGPNVQTVGQALYSLFQSFQFPVAGAVSMVLLAFVALVLIAVQRVTNVLALFEEVRR